MNHQDLILEVKSFDEEQRYITGMATTPTVDRVGDVIDPMGAQFEKEIPLFVDHDRKVSVGRVKLGQPTKKGIPFEAWIPKVDEDGLLKDRVDLAWHEVKYGLRKSVSIGLRVLNQAVERIENGWRYLKYEIFELSLVGVPAQADAKIHTFKSADSPAGATSRTSRPVVRLAETMPLDAGKSNPTTSGATNMKTIQERIADFKSQRETEVKALQAIVNKSIESGQTLDSEDKVKHAEIADRIKEIDEHIEMLQSSEALMVSKATSVVVPAGDGAVAKATAVRSSIEVPRIQLSETLPKGVEFAIYTKCLAASKGNVMQAVEIAKSHYPNMERMHGVLKAAVVGGTTTLSGFASQLVDYQRMANEFLEYLMPQTVIGKFGTNGIPDVTHVPFNVELSSMTNTGTANWVGEGAAKPVTRQTYANLTLGITKIAAITVLTDELIRLSNPRADMLTRDALGKAVTYRMNYDFLDTSKASSATSPASITYGATHFAATGTGDADDIVADMQKALGYFNAANIPATSLVWIMPSMVALALANKLNAFGAPQYPAMTMMGGTVGGIPVIVTDYVASDITSGSTVVLVSAENILLADDGVIVIDASNQVSIEMQDVPTSTTATGTGASLVSMWQANSTAFRAERWINWRTARTPSVVYITGVQWGEA